MHVIVDLVQALDSNVRLETPQTKRVCTTITLPCYTYGLFKFLLNKVNSLSQKILKEILNNHYFNSCSSDNLFTVSVESETPCMVKFEKFG